MQPTILSLDQSFTNSGVIIFRGERIMHFECIKSNPEETIPERISFITKRVLFLYKQYKCSAIVCEGLAFGSFGKSTRDLAGLLSSLEVKFYESIKLKEITKLAPTSIKKFATGSGKSNKRQMMDALPKDIYDEFYQAGYKRSSGLADLADAFFIGKMYMESITCES